MRKSANSKTELFSDLFPPNLISDTSVWARARVSLTDKADYSI